jgi:hypothetical protein
MKLTSKIKNIFLFLWAAAILWIYIGSLVNFHQHKIWGRPLLPQLLYAKRDKEQSLDFNKFIKSSVPDNINPDHPVCFNGISIYTADEYLNFASASYIEISANIIFKEQFIFSHGLRAPPLS